MVTKGFNKGGIRTYLKGKKKKIFKYYKKNVRIISNVTDASSTKNE